MAFDIKKSAGELVDKIKGDKSLAADFKKDPIKTVEKLLGVDLPDEQIKALVEMIKAKLGGGAGKLAETAENVKDAVADKLGGLLGKK